MNTSPTSPTTPDLELLRKAIREYQPDPSRVPFSNLKPFHDSIVELRGKNASYAAIAEILQQNGVKTSRARVAEYGRVLLEGGKRHKRRKRARTAPAAIQTAPPAVNTHTVPKSVPDAAIKVAPTVTNDAPSAPTEESPFTSRGPHIAKVELLPASELDY
jgi:hypothetical protein